VIRVGVDIERRTGLALQGEGKAKAAHCDADEAVVRDLVFNNPSLYLRRLAECQGPGGKWL
jgi:hypothetical protein